MTLAISLSFPTAMSTGAKPSRYLGPRTAQAASAATWGARQVGLHETGTSNCGTVVNRWVRDMGLRVPPCRPWCGAFVHQAFHQAGVKLSARLLDPELAYYDALANRRHLRVIPKAGVRRGDIVLMNYRRNKKASHAAIVTRHERGSSYITTAEGNAGHRVVLQDHHLSFMVLALRVDPKNV